MKEDDGKKKREEVRRWSLAVAEKRAEFPFLTREPLPPTEKYKAGA